MSRHRKRMGHLKNLVIQDLAEAPEGATEAKFHLPARINLPSGNEQANLELEILSIKSLTL